MNIVRFLALLPTMAAATVSAQPPHPFVCTDYSQGKVFIVNTAGTVEWEYPAKNCNDLWVLPGGNLLFNTRMDGLGKRCGTIQSTRLYRSSSITAVRRSYRGKTTFPGTAAAKRPA